MKVLIIVDIQNDFLAGGSLEVSDGNSIIPIINELEDKFDLIVATQDWHPANHKSFASNHKGRRPFETIILHGIEQILWPDHCIQGSPGADFSSELKIDSIETIFRKGLDPEIDSYSAFYDNHHRKSTGLTSYLREKEVDIIYFCGLCADICVYASIKDALTEGFTCFLIKDATRPLDKESYKKQEEELLKKGVKILTSNEID